MEPWMFKIYRYVFYSGIPMNEIYVYRAQPPRWILCRQEMKEGFHPESEGYMPLTEWIEKLKNDETCVQTRIRDS